MSGYRYKKTTAVFCWPVVLFLKTKLLQSRGFGCGKQLWISLLLHLSVTCLLYQFNDVINSIFIRSRNLAVAGSPVACFWHIADHLLRVVKRSIGGIDYRTQFAYQQGDAGNDYIILSSSVHGLLKSCIDHDYMSGRAWIYKKITNTDNPEGRPLLALVTIVDMNDITPEMFPDDPTVNPMHEEAIHRDKMTSSHQNWKSLSFA